ncbi:hypothetical protein FJ970_13020 [Mesorhizobium sp. B2-1-8]|uniref:hypothetical protein n=1 Tax=Mesorhizobium sp. B2-1-8 TaxID=2589967 RepID=UPI00112AD895|nr:hypothetical protein [Mesorhizobium sp. B2-1-8]UCI21813.1 hypothetical protein FJ970_13020 [Mesorhizobium sp. B2-1-8]
MLFSYPIEALGANWLNTSAVDVMLAGMDAIDANAEPESWPECLPEGRREILAQRTGLRSKLASFLLKYSELPAQERPPVRAAIMRQTALPNVFNDNAFCPTIDTLPLSIRAPARALAVYLFGQLASIKEGNGFLRDNQYGTIYAANIRQCPFCGLNYFRAPGAPRHALDHLLPISIYPFAAADLRNLPPACDECNSTYKGSTDILTGGGGLRRRCSDPYLGPTYRITLEGSEFFIGNEVGGYTLPRWNINIVGDELDRAETWNSVYQIKLRYSRDVLDADFLSWIGHYSKWFLVEKGRDQTADQVAAEVPRYIEGVVQDGYADRAFLKAEAFRLLDRSCNDPEIGEDVRQWLWNFVEYSN